jgi:hypothetical protein
MRMLNVGLALSLAAHATVAQEHQHAAAGAPGKLGKVHFKTSCAPSAQPGFDRAMALLHSFWFPAAIEAFDQVLREDPSCAIAGWGIAIAQWGNPFAGQTSPKAIQDGLAAIERAKSIGAKTERERDYVAAAELLYKDADKLDRRARTLAYEQAMEKLSAKYPDDPEAAAYYGLTLAWIASPTDKTYAKQLKGAAILEKLFAKQPEHPGLAHYIIHAYDVPPLAERALDAARRYAKIAPAAPHALHMPSHTFTRVGYWQDSIETNRASAEAAKRANSPGEVLHAYDYQAYAYLQTAQDKQAERVLGEVKAMTTGLDPKEGFGYGLAGAFAMAAIPARHALERGAWADAAALVVRPSPVPWVDAMTHFARALGAARSGNPAAAKPDLERLAALRDALKGKDDYWEREVEIQRLSAAAWVAKAEDRNDEALALMRQAADLQDGSEKSAITPGPLAPARELLGELLLESGQARPALAEFEKNLEKERNRFRSVHGAAKASAQAGDQAKAKKYYAQLLQICAKADTQRVELQEARKAAGKAD